MKKNLHKVFHKIAWFALIVLLFSIGIYAYNYIIKHIWWFLIISGSIVLLAVIAGILSHKTAWKRFKSKIKDIFD